MEIKEFFPLKNLLHLQVFELNKIGLCLENTVKYTKTKKLVAFFEENAWHKNRGEWGKFKAKNGI